MNLIKIIFTLVFLITLSTSLLAQVETTMKETKVKVEQKVDKASKQLKEEKSSDVKKSLRAECQKECCIGKAMVEEAKMSATAPSNDCDCEACSTVESASKKMEMINKAHSADCDCEGCRMTKAEVNKKLKNHHDECSCEGCAKT